jgi:hypothetical protein
VASVIVNDVRQKHIWIEFHHFCLNPFHRGNVRPPGSPNRVVLKGSLQHCYGTSTACMASSRSDRFACPTCGRAWVACLDLYLCNMRLRHIFVSPSSAHFRRGLNCLISLPDLTPDVGKEGIRARSLSCLQHPSGRLACPPTS